MASPREAAPGGRDSPEIGEGQGSGRWSGSQDRAGPSDVTQAPRCPPSWGSRAGSQERLRGRAEGLSEQATPVRGGGQCCLTRGLPHPRTALRRALCLLGTGCCGGRESPSPRSGPSTAGGRTGRAEAASPGSLAFASTCAELRQGSAAPASRSHPRDAASQAARRAGPRTRSRGGGLATWPLGAQPAAEAGSPPAGGWHGCQTVAPGAFRGSVSSHTGHWRE